MAPARTLRAACLQVHAGRDRAANMLLAEELVRRAAADGATLVVLPEKWTGYGTDDLLDALAEDADGGPAAAAMSSWAAALGITLIGGSITERRPGRERYSNTTLAFGPDGKEIGRYRKIHLFDVDVDGRCYRESDRQEPGGELTSVRAEGWSIGLSICYDLRFPELYRELSAEGVHAVVVPAAFTATTGEAHWETLVRARAIENQAFVLAPNQWGDHGDGVTTYGHSLIVDPWGRVLARTGGSGDAVVTAELDFEVLERVRATLPSLAHRRLSLHT
ncbi:Deaminated glutathione amidase [Baekduia alba]|uniref:carbon-nitrogen hydrolase family protein n=1 Tax=Baekduia alba TaxID=2997333 RepID=UPI0023417EC0|nr:carbon-nitrogen hydrolase family protein [Baekduia alba]WCB92264.1 Deaminated glutathione amidase [Baekduia alba]